MVGGHQAVILLTPFYFFDYLLIHFLFRYMSLSDIALVFIYSYQIFKILDVFSDIPKNEKDPDFVVPCPPRV